jgi:hypothetical protein
MTAVYGAAGAEQESGSVWVTTDESGHGTMSLLGNGIIGELWTSVEFLGVGEEL